MYRNMKSFSFRVDQWLGSTETKNRPPDIADMLCFDDLTCPQKKFTFRRFKSSPKLRLPIFTLTCHNYNKIFQRVHKFAFFITICCLCLLAKCVNSLRVFITFSVPIKKQTSNIILLNIYSCVLINILYIFHSHSYLSSTEAETDSISHNNVSLFLKTHLTNDLLHTLQFGTERVLPLCLHIHREEKVFSNS